MAGATKTAGVKEKKAKKPVTKGQADRVANFLKSQGNGGPALPTPKSNPVVTDDDGDESQGA